MNFLTIQISPASEIVSKIVSVNNADFSTMELRQKSTWKQRELFAQQNNIKDKALKRR